MEYLNLPYRKDSFKNVLSITITFRDLPTEVCMGQTLNNPTCLHIHVIYDIAMNKNARFCNSYCFPALRHHVIWSVPADVSGEYPAATSVSTLNIQAVRNYDVSLYHLPDYTVS
jgi:hypothetical protein